MTLVALCLAGTATAAPAKHKPAHKHAVASSSHIVSPTDGESSPAYRYGALSQDACEAELGARHIPFVRETAPGVLAPVRLGGPLHGVVFRTDLGEKARATSPWEIADCRLVLALDDFAAAVLSKHDIVEVRHYSIYRPPGKSWPDGKISAQHIGAVAIDAGKFVKSNGEILNVDKDFHGAIDAPTCGASAGPKPATPEALELRAILCSAVDLRLFNVVLTPNYNRPHHNHFHLEVNGAKWFLVH